MEIVFIEQDGYFDHNRHLRGRWNVQLFPTGEVVARITEGHSDAPSTFVLATYGKNPKGNGNRYRNFSSLDEAQEVATKWARRRFK